MDRKKGGAGSVVFFVFLLALLGVAIYLLYLNLPGEPVDLIFQEGDDSGEKVDIVYQTSSQFYENMRFRDRRISYKIEPACGSDKVSEVEEAFSIIEGLTSLEFYQDPNQREITIFCSDIEPEPQEEGFFVAGEGGPTEVINTSLYGVILSGKISFFREEKCDEPKIAIHELLHVLGFDHNSNPDSILYSTLDCDQTVDNAIIENLNELYSVESVPDLKIVNVDSTKAGRYLDFDIEIINQGLMDADDVVLSIYADDEFVKDFILEEIDIGTKKFLEVTNLKLPSRFIDKIEFYVDKENEIPELYEQNNKVELILS